MAKSKKSKNKIKKSKGGSFWNDLANLALIPGIATLASYKLSKKIAKKKKSNKMHKNKKGGFIRDGSTQFFNGNTTSHKNQLVYTTEGKVQNDVPENRGGQTIKYK